MVNQIRMITTQDMSIEKARQLLENVYDPEIPVLSVIDLGIVRDVHLIKSPIGEESLEVTITPTYSGCPAMDVIAINIKMAALQNGFKNVKIIQQLSPAWTTDWMTEKAKDKLIAYGLAPPRGKSFDKKYLEEDLEVECPQCRSKDTTLLSQFGSTACKALYKCNNCKEPFDYFKCH